MWFKNLRIYRFTQPFNLDVNELNNALTSDSFTPCRSQDISRYGWVTPSPPKSTSSDNLVHACQGYFMICAKKQEKVLPAAVINEALEEKVAAIAEKDGRPVHRKERQSLKDDIIMELLPKAFTRSQLQFAYIAPKQNYIVVNAASANKAEELLSALRESIGSLPVTPLTSLRLPYEAMTDWVLNGSLSEQFIIGSECELSDPKESGSVIRCKYQDLASPEITSHIKGGMIVTQLSLNWQDGLEFVLDDKLAIKRMRFADNICEKADSYDSQDAIDQFDNEFSVMTIELSAFIDNLTAALGGINKDIATTD